MADDVRNGMRDSPSEGGATSVERRTRLVRARPPLKFIPSKNGDGSNAKTPSDEELSTKDFRHLIHISSAEIGCFIFEAPIRCDLPGDAFAQEIYRTSARCIEGNHRLADSAGLFRPEDLLNASLSDVLPPRLGFDEMFREWHRHSLTGQGFDVHALDRKGHNIVYHAAIYGRIDNERLTRIWVILRDITTLARAIRALGRTEKHYRTLVETTDTLFLRALPDGSIDYASQNSKTLLGMSSLGNITLDVMLGAVAHPADKEAIKKLAEHRESGIEAPRECMIRLRSDDQTYSAYTIRQAAHINSTGELDYFDLFAYPATRSNMLAEHPSSSITPYAAGIIHDVNNQLMVIRSQLEMGLTSEATSNNPSPECLRQALEATKLASMMTSHALGRSNSESNTGEFVSVRGLLETIVSSLRHITPPSVILRIEPCSPLLSVRAHLPHLHQILTNVILNARDAMIHSGTITLGASERASSVVITVSDDGCGMSPELLEKAFVPFFSTKPKDKGSGLGLSMVRELARRNHGEIEIRSEIHRGTVVSIILPCGPPEYVSGTSPQSTIARDRPITILVADDETSVRDTLLAALSRQGYIVCAVPDGRSILEELKRRINECDLVVIDDGMPSMSARELISAIRTIAPKLPMLLTSGDPSRVKILSADFEPCAFLAKPFGLDELYTRIELLIRSR